MERVAPSRAGSRMPVKQLGSLEAVLSVLPDDGVLIVSSFDRGQHALQTKILMRGPGAGKVNLRFLIATSGPNALYELPPGTVIGVDVDAFHGVPGAMWADMQRILSSRFQTVHWG